MNGDRTLNTAHGQGHETQTMLDARGLSCPMPLLKTKLQLNRMQVGECLEVLASDAGSAKDIPAFLKLSRHALVSMEEQNGVFRFVIRRG